MTFAAALDAIGYRGTERCGEHPLSAFFELHIEQGPILEAEGQGHRRRHRRAGDALVRGDDHRPGCAHRRDADASAQECAARRRAADRAVDAIGRKHPPGVATVGRIENRPNSPNVVPGEVFFMIDLRHPGRRARSIRWKRTFARRCRRSASRSA